MAKHRESKVGFRGRAI